MKIDIVCILSALLFILGNILTIVYGHRLYDRNHFNYDDMIDLDSKYIQEEWAFRSNTNHRMHITSSIINSLAWCFFIIPVLRFIILNSFHGTRQVTTHLIIAILVIGGSYMEMIATLFHLGIINTAQWIADNFNLHQWIDNKATDSDSGSNNDNIGWKTLELVHIVIRGMLVWVNAMEWLFLSITFIMFFISVRNQIPTDRIFSFRFAIYSILPATLCTLDLVVDILLNFKSWRMTSNFRIAMVITYMNRFFLFPTWLLWLGIELPKAEQSIIDYNTNNLLGSKTAAAVPATTTGNDSGGDGTTSNVNDDATTTKADEPIC